MCRFELPTFAIISPTPYTATSLRFRILPALHLNPTLRSLPLHHKCNNTNVKNLGWLTLSVCLKRDMTSGDRKGPLSYSTANVARTASRRALQNPPSKSNIPRTSRKPSASSGRACPRRRGRIGSSWRRKRRKIPTTFTGQAKAKKRQSIIAFPRTNTTPTPRAHPLPYSWLLPGISHRAICICSDTPPYQAIQIPNIYHMIISDHVIITNTRSLPKLVRLIEGTEGLTC